MRGGARNPPYELLVFAVSEPRAATRALLPNVLTGIVIFDLEATTRAYDGDDTVFMCLLRNSMLGEFLGLRKALVDILHWNLLDDIRRMGVGSYQGEDQ